jgi:ribosomal protein S18 acetylase RimI-like enzyme
MALPSTSPAEYAVRECSQAEFLRRLDELLRVYVDAMRYPDLSLDYRRPIWADHSRRPGFRALVAQEVSGEVAGICYGYTGAPQQWWYSEVRRGLTDAGAAHWMSSYRELTELHVRPDRQGGGIGEALLRAFLAGAAESTVLLSTPEGENRAWRLYRRTGFVDVLRHYRFSGDPRPFAVLGRPLPFDEPGRSPR